MARDARLSAGPGARRGLLILACVLVAHGVLIEWMAQRFTQPDRLKPLATPMFTRVLQPQAPPETPAAAPAEPAAPPPRPGRLAARSATAAAPAASAPARPAPVDAEPAAPATELAAAVAAMLAAAAPQPARDPAGENPAAAAPAPAVAASEPAAPTIPASASAPADGWPADTRLNYRLGGRFRSGDLYGSARVQWQREGARYQAQVEVDVSLLASLVLTSQGEIGTAGLLPRVYEERRRGRIRGARLDESAVVLADGRSVPRPAGVQDTASQFVELSHRFATGRDRLEVGGTVSVWLARPGAVDLWTYDIVGREMLQTTQLGEVEAFHLKPRPIANPRGNITAEMWFAPSLQYLPVRIRVSMGDEAQVDLMVESIEQR